LLGLSPSLTDDKDELLLLLTKDSPEGVGHSEDGRFSRSSKSHDKQVLNIILLSQLEESSVERSRGIFDVVGEVEVEEVEM